MNKKISLFALGAALIAVPVLAAPGGAKADTDGNGTLTRTEAQAHAAQMFAKLDFNRDGKIDAADRTAKHSEMHAKKFASLDADGNGSISQAEWNAHGADRAAKRAERGGKRADAGDASEGKRHGMRGPGKRGGHDGMRGGMMGKADTNGDKAISQAEFQSAALARFDASDANKDGQVTAEERQTQRGEWRAKRAAPTAPASQ